MVHERPVTAAMESRRRVERDAVAGGDALVLPEVLEPRLDDERLDPARRITGILVDVPADRAVAPANGLETAHGAEKRVLLGRVDPILERDEDRSFVAVELADRLR